jgi:glycosyltransferase involved in cell wall biosynthesis
MPANEAVGPTPDLTVVLPAHNEEAMLSGTVEELVDGLRARGHRFEMLIVENGSTDRTLAVARELEALHPEVSVLTNPSADYGRSLQRGLLSARAPIVVSFDVDYFDLGFLDQAAAILRGGAAGIVVGTKRGEGAQDDRPWSRRIVTGGFSLLLRKGFGLRASDTHGIKALAGAQVVPLAERCQLGTDLFDTELVLRAERAGIVVGEVPVRVVERRPARSSIARRIVRTLVGLRTLRRALRTG